MKTKIIFALMIFFLMGMNLHAQTKKINIKNMCDVERNQYLTDLAKELTLTFGPEYYQIIKGTPKISELKKFETGEDTRVAITKNAGKEFYEITLPYDTTKIILDWDYASKVQIWSDTGSPIAIIFGNGMGLNFLFDDLNTIKKSKKIVPLQQADNKREYDLIPSEEDIKEYKKYLDKK